MKVRSFTPFKDVLLIEKEDSYAQFTLIVIPDNCRERPTFGHVIRSGPGRVSHQTGVTVPMECTTGDRVCFERYGGYTLTLDGKQYQVLGDRDILMVERDGKWMPTRDRLLVRAMGLESFTKKGLALPENRKEKPAQGVVVAVGRGDIDEHGRRHHMECKPGDRIYFQRWAGSEMRINGENLRIIRETTDVYILLSENHRPGDHLVEESLRYA